MPRTYQLTAGTVINKARTLLNDTIGPDFRASDSELLGHLNDAINAMVGVFPGLFAVFDTHTTIASYIQTLENDRAVMFLDVVGVPEGDAATLAQFSPQWMTATPGAVREFMRVAGDPLRFMTYPPATAGQTLQVRMVKSPVPIAATATVIPVPEAYEPALVEYLVGRAEFKDDEHAVSGRASALMDRFVASVKNLAI